MDLGAGSAGPPYWATVRLFAWAKANRGQVDGALLRQGVDLDAWVARDPARAFNILYSYAVEGMDEKARGKFESQLRARPPGREFSRVRPGTMDPFDRAMMAAAEAHRRRVEQG